MRLCVFWDVTLCGKLLCLCLFVLCPCCQTSLFLSFYSSTRVCVFVCLSVGSMFFALNYLLYSFFWRCSCSCFFSHPFTGFLLSLRFCFCWPMLLFLGTHIINMCFVCDSLVFCFVLFVCLLLHMFILFICFCYLFIFTKDASCPLFCLYVYVAAQEPKMSSRRLCVTGCAFRF